MRECAPWRATVVSAAVVLLILFAPLGLCALAETDIYNDDFDDPYSGWETWTDEQGGYDYRDGEFAFWTHESSVIGWSQSPGTPRYLEEFVVEASAYRYSGAAQAMYGIVWETERAEAEDPPRSEPDRAQRPRDKQRQSYFFYVSTDGYYNVQLLVDGEWQTDPIGWTPSGSIAQHDGVNRLRLIVANGQATIAVNDICLASFDLGDAGPYSVRITGGPESTASVEVRFTEFVLRVPEENELETLRNPPGCSLPFIDNFSDETGGWADWRDDSGGLAYREGEYAIWCTEPFLSFRAYSPLREACSSGFEVTVTAYKFSGEDDAVYGIIWGGDMNNHYLFLVRADGWYKASLLLNDEWQTDPIEWTQSPHVRQGEEPNTLTLSVRDGLVTLGVNEAELTSFEPTLHGPYRVGVDGESFETAPVEVRFTAFQVLSLD